MAIEVDCAGCMLGQHEHHDRGHGLRPGVIGGSYCGCRGDCAERFAKGAQRFLEWVRGTADPVPRSS